MKCWSPGSGPDLSNGTTTANNFFTSFSAGVKQISPLKFALTYPSSEQNVFPVPGVFFLGRPNLEFCMFFFAFAAFTKH